MTAKLPLLPITHWLLKAAMVFVALIAALLVVALAGIAAIALSRHYLDLPPTFEGVALPELLTLCAWAVGLGLAAMAIVFFALRETAEIVALAISDDPFIDKNAQRLIRIGWLLVGLASIQPLGGLVVNPMAEKVAAAHTDIKIDLNGIGWDISPISILAILLVFVLAQIFRRGAEMRSELEGTV
jgi:hypothetical protein